jgi:PKD repeat protein
MFTDGQKIRMQASLNSSIANRNNLWTPANLIATGVNPQATLCAADFEADRTLICNPSGEAVTFTNTSYHGVIDSVYWEFLGGVPPFSVMEEPTVVYSQPGVYDVSLTVYSNGQSQQITKADHITFLPDSSWPTPFWDWFEGNSNLEGMPWSENSLDEDNRWEITEVASHSPGHSVWVDNWENDRLTVDELYGPSMDLSAASQMKLAFKYAFTNAVDAPSGSKLQIQVSRNCETSWSTRLSLTGAGFETAMAQSVPFVPTSEQWNQEVVNIPSSYLEEGFRFRFAFTSNGKNRLFLDDINVDITAGIEDPWLSDKPVFIYPNPAVDALNIQFTLDEASKVGFKVFDIAGKAIQMVPEQQFGAGSNVHNLNVNTLESGVYLLRMEWKGNTLSKRFIIF